MTGPGWDLDSSPETAAAVLHGLFGWASSAGELIEISIKAPSGKWNSEHVPASELYTLDTVKRMSDWSAAGRETYVGCVGLTEKPKYRWRRGGAALRGHAGALWIDVDVEAPGRTGPEYFGSVDEAVAGVDKALGTELADAALVIGSGWGVQYWIPLAEPVPARTASRAVRVLVGYLAERTGAKIDRVWDVTRVMRMPGTWNWRAGPDADEARATGVIRMPRRPGGAPGRLRIGNVTALMAGLVSDVTGELAAGDVSSSEELLDVLVDRYGGTVGAEDSDPGAKLGDWVGDIERIADTELTWAEVLEPFGWRCTTDNGHGFSHDEHEMVWERPGKDPASGVREWGARTGERSAVVYADRSELLVVYSDSPACGFADGLRGSGHRGEGAGVGVISKWRAWVDLAWAGDGKEALRAVTSGEVDGADEIGKRLADAWTSETAWMADWWEEALEPGLWEAHRKEAGWVDP